MTADADKPQIVVKIDNRIRLLSAVLSLTTWPEQEQAYSPHGVHHHAKATRAFLKDAESHPAVEIMQELLESNLSMDDIFSYATCLNYPGLRAKGSALPPWAPKNWSAHLRDFNHSLKLRELWEAEENEWQKAKQEAERALNTGDPKSFLERFFGPMPDLALRFQPNLAYPTADSMGFRWNDKLWAVSPPRIAWGTNPPWPYDDDPAATFAEVIGAYAKVLLRELLDKHPEEAEAAQKGKLPVPNTFVARYPEWFDQFAVLFVTGVTSIFLEETFSAAEAKAYSVMAQKAHGFKQLPSVIDVLNRYLGSHNDGKFETFGEYLPTFSNALRVAAKLKSL
ncbi:MAG: hypothetical protein GYB68_00990 [Chloroflexi bacterium]|nr:hypothetical protein [Chloroflexota bacterium]